VFENSILASLRIIFRSAAAESRSRLHTVRAAALSCPMKNYLENTT
jgi:hypothetical protein